MLYEPRMYAKLIGLSASNDVQIEFSFCLEKYGGQELKLLTPIVIGNTINIAIAIRGVAGGIIELEHLSDSEVVMAIADASTTALVRAAVGANVYTLNTSVKLDGSVVKKSTGTIDQNSDIEIL